MIPSFHSTALATASLDLAHSLARYLQMFVILEARCAPKLSFVLITGYSNIFRDAWRNGRAGIARRVARALRATATTYVVRGAQVPFTHGRRQIRDDVVILTVTQQVDPLGCGLPGRQTRCCRTVDLYTTLSYTVSSATRPSLLTSMPDACNNSRTLDKIFRPVYRLCNRDRSSP